MNNLNLQSLLTTHLSDGSSAFSVGGMGAIAEFQATDPIIRQSNTSHFCATSKLGSLSIKIDGSETGLAYETVGSKEDTWQWGILLSVPKKLCGIKTSTILTEMGEDHDAHSSTHQKDLLFDLGTGIPNMKFCVRTNDNDLIIFLRKYEGQTVTSEGHPVLNVMIDASPHRVVTSQIARIEVYQKIDRHLTSSGPHTHLLPKLLKVKKSHSSKIPIPPDHAPQLTIHPENPLYDLRGHRRKFQKDAYDKFLPTFKAFSKPEFYQEKMRLRNALLSRTAPDQYPPPNSRLARMAHEIELRQRAHLGEDKTYLDQWRKTKSN